MKVLIWILGVICAYYCCVRQGQALPTLPPGFNINCTWAGTQWFPWAACSEECGGGERTREWDQGAPAGSTCLQPNKTTETEPCNEICENDGTALGGGLCACPITASGDCCECKRCYTNSGINYN